MYKGLSVLFVGYTSLGCTLHPIIIAVPANVTFINSGSERSISLLEVTQPVNETFEHRARMLQPSCPVPERTGGPGGVRPMVCVYSGVGSSSSGGIGQTQGVLTERADTGRSVCVCVSGGIQRISLLTTMARTRVRTLSWTNSKETDRKTKGFGGWGPPDMHGPLPGRGALGKGRQTQWRLNAPPP